MTHHREPEITIRTVKSSPSLLRMFVSYKNYCFACILDSELIKPIERWYWDSKEDEDVKTSRIFEKYLRLAHSKETLKK